MGCFCFLNFFKIIFYSFYVHLIFLWYLVPRSVLSVSVPFKAPGGEVDHRSAVRVFNILVSLVWKRKTWLINENDHTCKTFNP